MNQELDDVLDLDDGFVRCPQGILADFGDGVGDDLGPRSCLDDGESHLGGIVDGLEDSFVEPDGLGEICSDSLVESVGDGLEEAVGDGHEEILGHCLG